MKGFQSDKTSNSNENQSAVVSVSRSPIFQRKEVDSSKNRKVFYVDKDACSSFFLPGYPEENVYRLVQLLRDNIALVASLAELHVVFIGSHHKQTYLWSQCSHLPEHQDSGQSICDYHCILLQTTMSDSAALGGPASSDNPHIVPENTITYVWDLESTLAFPTRLAAYAEHALRVRHITSLGTRFQRTYRVVPAELYLRYFASDRKHHPRKIDGTWSDFPQPSLPCIVTEQNWKNTVDRYLDRAVSGLSERSGRPGDLSETEKLQLEDELRYGTILDEGAFLARFGVKVTTAE